MSERDASADGLCSDAAADYIPPRASRGRRSGVILPAGGQDTDTFLLESVKAAPRRSSIIKVRCVPPPEMLKELVLIKSVAIKWSQAWTLPSSSAICDTTLMIIFIV